MATDKADNVTKSLFDKTEQEQMMEALRAQEKTLRRKINTEPNRLIKQIHQDNLQHTVNLINKLQGL